MKIVNEKIGKEIVTIQPKEIRRVDLTLKIANGSQFEKTYIIEYDIKLKEIETEDD